MKFETIVYKKDGNVSIIKLNRPETYNAFDLDMGDEVVKALELCSDDPGTRAVILTGEGRAFCSGGDLLEARKYLKTNPSDSFRQLTKIFNRIILEIRFIPKPVLAAVNGAVGAGGMSLAAACDLRIAASSAKFRQAFTRKALAPDGGWSLLIPLLIGLGRASELIYLDPVIDAQKALDIGLVNKVVPDAELEQVSLDMAATIAQGPTQSYAIAKDYFNNAILSLLERQAEIERQGIVKAAKTSDYKEGLTAFFEKRPPIFTGQ